ncbi:hypothetical protein AAFF_G00122690 [Aldrovandia affinis]|uniref:Cathelicidin n=1 Tax=Aldrovandia affinis TaxID=143900 RepID=A0AAD7WAX5_9TELE|nr:hypothetical protein AAFF_G00122690 [Aldrovandia affinis]
MKALVKALLVGLAAVLVTAQRGEYSYEAVISDATSRYIQRAGEESAFRPLLRALQVETLHPESVDQPVVVRKLRFPLHETVCLRTEEQMGKPCPLKKNGKSLLCEMTLLQPVLEATLPLNTEMGCEPMTTADPSKLKIRMRRSKSNGGNKGSGGNKGGNKGGNRGGNRGSRPGGGSSIAGGGNRGNSGTRTA